MKTIIRILKAARHIWSIKRQRSLLAKSIIFDRRCIYHTTIGDRFYVGTPYTLPDGTEGAYWSPSPSRLGCDGPSKARTRAAIARREIPLHDSEPWRTTVPFDSRSWNPYTIQSHR